MRLCVLLLALVAAVTAVDPCKRQPFRGRCPSQNGETPKRSQFVLRYYLRSGECVSYPYGHCASDPSEPTLYRYKEECEDSCISNAPANLGVPKSTTEDYQKEILAKEVKRVEFLATSTDSQSRFTTRTTEPTTTTTTTTMRSTTTTTEQTTTTSTEDSQPFEFHELPEPAPVDPISTPTRAVEQNEHDDDSEQEQPFTFNNEFDQPSTTTTSTQSSQTPTRPVYTQTTTEEPSTTTTTELPVTEPSTTTTTEEVTATTITEEPTTTVTITEKPTTTTEAVTTTVTTTEEPTTTTEQVTTTTRMSTTTTTTSAPSTTTTTSRPRQTSTTTEASTTTTTEEVTEAPTTTEAAPRTECERRRASAATSSIRGAFVPVCTASGDFERVQCETDGRQCFCVDSHGIEVPNSRTRDGSRPDCYTIQSSRPVSTKECVGASAPGPCHGSFPRFFYNEDTQKCESFTYSGCGGNGNNYESKESCEGRCAPPPVGLPKCEIGEPLKTKIGVPVNCAKTDCPSGYRCSVVQHSSVCCPENNKALGLQTNGRASRCALPKERGPCDKYELRFYFNADLNECKYFFWGGCEGNLNNFERVEECESACGVQRTGEPPRVTNKPNTEIRTTQGIRITPNAGKLNWEEDEEVEVQATTPLAPAPTTRAPVATRTPAPTTTTRQVPPQTVPTTRAARISTTTAPESADDDQEEEEEVVDEDGDEQKEQPLHVQPPVPQQNSVLLGVNRCLHPRDAGNCRGQFVRWFFDAEKKNCDVFTYTGCQGNGNNFASREECMAICHKPEPTPSATPDFTQVCSNDVDAGECNGVFERFAFDSETSDCRAFTYGGCGGNGNNFATLAECRSRCVGKATSTKPVNSCDADIDIGDCSGVFPRFAFDKSINSCRAFTYGGCGGNANNFATLQECTNKCVNRGVCPETPACDITRCQLVNDRSGCPFCSCPPVKQASPPGTIVGVHSSSLPKCAPLDRAACREPCMMFHNRQGCEECVCPQTAPIPPSPTRQPSSGLPQPPASSSTTRRVEVGPPAPRTTEVAPPAPNTQPPKQFAVNTVESQQTKLPTLPHSLAAQIEEKCLQPVEPGPCKNFADRWYFNVDDGTCHPFKYGGCAGNRNHFFTQKECEVHCARFLSGQHDVSTSSSSSSAPHANSHSTSSSEAPTSSEATETAGSLEAFPAPKLHHRQFAAPNYQATGNPIAYGGEKIEEYTPPTANSNLVGLSPPVHPTYFTYNGQDQGQRRLFSAGQQNFENRVDPLPQVPQQLQPLRSAPAPIQGRGRFDGRQRSMAPEDIVTPGRFSPTTTSSGPEPIVVPRQFASKTEVPSGRRPTSQNQEIAPEQPAPQSRFHPRTHTSEPVDVVRNEKLENFGRAPESRRPTTPETENFEEERRQTTPEFRRPTQGTPEFRRPTGTTPEAENFGNGRQTTSDFRRPENVGRQSTASDFTQRTPEARRPNPEAENFGRTLENFGTGTQSENFERPTQRAPESRRPTPEVTRPIPVTSQHGRAPEVQILGRQVSSFQPTHSGSSSSSTFPHRFVTSSPAATSSTPWYQTTSAPWWLRSPAPSTATTSQKKRPELKIEKLEKIPPRFNFDPSRYTFYNGDYYGPTIPGIRVNQTGGLFVQGGNPNANGPISEAEKKEAQEAFEQFRELSKGFQEQASKFLEQERAQGRAPQRGTFIIGSVRTGGLHDNEESEEESDVEEEQPPRRQGLRAHGVPIQPTVPLVVPTYAAPTPAVRGPPVTGKIEGLEHIGAFHEEPHPPAPSTTIVPRLPQARIQGFQVTQRVTSTSTVRPTTTTTTSTTTTTTTTEAPTSTTTVVETAPEENDAEEVAQPVIKEVQEEKVGGNVVDLEKFNVTPPRAEEPSQEFDREMLGSGAGSGSEFEEESAEEVEEEFPSSTTTSEAPRTSSESEELTTTTPLKKIQIRPRGSTTTTTTTTTTEEPVTSESTTSEPSTTTSESITTTTTASLPSSSSSSSTSSVVASSTTTTSTVVTTSAEQDEHSTPTHQRAEPEMITSSEAESDFAFNSDEEHDDHDANTEIIETTEPVRAAGSKTLEAAKAVETVKPHKEQIGQEASEEENGISRKLESINIDVPETTRTETLAPVAPSTTTIPTTIRTVPIVESSQTPQPHFEPKFDGRIVCAMPPDAGVCTNYTPRWFFNSQTGQCEQFAYGSCGGNENNFYDRNTCERKCMPHHVILAQVPERCSFDKDAGSGKGYNVKWYFNMKNLRCEQFVFEGLGGNTNQFETLSECERICTPSGPKTPTLPPVAPELPQVPELPLAPAPAPAPVPAQELPRAPVVAPTTTTTAAAASNLDLQDSQEEYDDEDPIILPEANEMPPLPNVAPATFGLGSGIINENVELRLPEIAQTVQPTLAPTTAAPTAAPVAPTTTTTTAAPPAPAAPVAQTVAQSLPTPPPSAPIAPEIHPAPELSPEFGAESTESESVDEEEQATPLPPSVEPRPPAAHAAKTVITEAVEQKKTYKAEPVLGREHIPTANDGQPIVGASPKETVNYQTGEVKTAAKASGIRSFDGSQDSKISVDLFNKGPTRSSNGMPACANGRTEVRYSDGRPVMCLPGKNQCPDGSSCYFNGIDFFCCPEEEDPYDKHAFGGYGGDETKNGYKVFGALNIRRLMDEVPLRLKRQAQVNFNIDSVVAPLRFDAEKPRTVSRALRMKSSGSAVPRHGANPLCIQPVVKGSCQEAHLRYYYDRVTDSCRLFEYSGCDGNANNFGSLEDCQRLCVLNVNNIKNGQIATTTSAPNLPEEEEKLAPGQCPGGRAPLGGSSPVLCGNSTESIGCPTSYYCRRGPPDVCCPGTDPKLMQPEEIVKEAGRGVVKNESHMPRGFNRQIFLSTPKYMCPDAADPLMLENGEPMLCGSGFDGVKMCPKGYYCAIDSSRNSRLCCPLYGDAQRIASEEIFAPRLASNTETTTQKVTEDVEVEDSGDDEDDEGEDFVAHLQMKPNKPANVVEELAKTSPLAADLSAEGGVSIDLGADEEKAIEEEVTTTTEKMTVQDKSVCQIKPSEGRMCNDDETATRTNLQYFYSPRDNRCKLFFFRGCGGNLNRFEKKSDCEALCL